MATAQEYAAWIVKNADKRGTPEFDIVAQAYQFAKSQETTAVTQQQIAPPPRQPTLGQQLVGAGETALTFGTAATGGTLGTIGGVLKGLSEQILSGQFGTPEAMKAVEQAAAAGGQALTYQPRTETGQEMAQSAGQFLATALPPVLPVVAAPGQLVQATRQAAPVVQATARRGATAAQQAARATGQVVARPVQAATTAVRETLGIEPAAPSPARVTTPSVVTTAAPGESMGTALSPAVAGRGSVGAAATPEVLRRTATAEGLPVPVTLTKGAATRDAQQLAFEKEQIKSDLGGPLRQRAEENNLQLLQNFDNLIEMTDAQLMDLSSTGGAVVKSLTEGLTAAKNKTRAAYKAAEKAGELENNVTLNSVIGYINENIPEGDLAPVLRAARSKAIAVGAAVQDENGNLVAQPVTLKQAESLRQTFQRAGFEGADQFHGGSLRRVFDTETEGMGGDLYKKARATRIEQARKYENRAIVARLIKNRKGMEDPQVASDQVFRKSILNSSPDEITFLKRVLLTSGQDGQQAWKELQGATVRHLRDEATKGMGMDSQDRPLISPAKLHQTVKALDANGRLDVMLGKQNAQIVRDLDDVVRYVTTVPPGTLVNTSGTAGTLMAAIAEAGATGALTGLPLPVATGLRQIVKMRKEGRTKAKINEALNALPPVQP
jgi:hypothetical protein